MEKFATKICKNYIGGVWKELTVDNIKLKRIPGGLSNLLYLVSLPKFLREEVKNEPQEVLLRIYGQTHGDNIFDPLLTESVIFTLLSERGIGPKLYGIFPGGRIEQYIPAKPLKTEDLADRRLSKKIASKMAKIHRMNFPIEKEPKWIWRTMHKWLDGCKESPKTLRLMKSLKADLDEEFEWLRKKVKSNGTIPVVFCHNDVNGGNILLKSYDKYNPNDPKIAIIDLEYCSYNYRAFDISNHFLEWTYDYTNKKHPFFIPLDNYPNRLQRLDFIKEYLKQLESAEDPEKLMEEVELFTLVSHYFWSLWSFFNEERTDIFFGYSEYGAFRFREYLSLKQDFLKKTAVLNSDAANN